MKEFHGLFFAPQQAELENALLVRPRRWDGILLKMFFGTTLSCGGGVCS